MIGQCGEDGGGVVGADRLPKAEFRRQQTGALLKLAALLVEQAQEDALADTEFLLDGLPGNLVIGGVDHQER